MVPDDAVVLARIVKARLPLPACSRLTNPITFSMLMSIVAENVSYVVRSGAEPEAGTGGLERACAGRYHIGRPAMMRGTPATRPNTSEE